MIRLFLVILIIYIFFAKGCHNDIMNQVDKGTRIVNGILELTEDAIDKAKSFTIEKPKIEKKDSIK